MKLVIDIDEKTYNEIMDDAKNTPRNLSHYERIIANGTPLPKGHGRLIDKDHMIARLEAASKFYGGENADAFDERFSHGLKEAAIKVAEEPTIIEADKVESQEISDRNLKMWEEIFAEERRRESEDRE